MQTREQAIFEAHQGGKTLRQQKIHLQHLLWGNYDQKHFSHFFPVLKGLRKEFSPRLRLLHFLNAIQNCI
jgi:hypothetical protein